MRVAFIGVIPLLWPLVRSIGVALLTLAAAVASLLLLDCVNPPAVVVDPGIAAVDSGAHGRLLVLHVDSWRYDTAIDSTLMPRVAELRKQGASWEMDGVFEGFTVPAVRAAFSGHAETQLVNLVQNFRFEALGIESFFHDASRIGKRTLVVAVEPFTQFGPYFEQRSPETRGLDMYQADRLRPGMALRAFREEGFDVESATTSRPTGRRTRKESEPTGTGASLRMRIRWLPNSPRRAARTTTSSPTATMAIRRPVNTRRASTFRPSRCSWARM